MSTSVLDIPEKRLFRPAEVAKLLDIHVQTVYRWCDNGKIDFLRIGDRTMRIERDCIIKIIRFSDEVDNSS
jgi:excisionase family DNA binding protein